MTIEALNRFGTPIASDQVTISYTGSVPVNQPWINEWLVINATRLADPADGDFEPWIEIYNPMNVVMDLSGYTLTDSASAPTKWLIPPETKIPPGGFLLVWADNEPAQNGSFGLGSDLHANFTLPIGGGFIGLYRPDQSQADAITFGAQTADVSQGRSPDGSTTVQTMTSPTPRLPNQ